MAQKHLKLQRMRSMSEHVCNTGTAHGMECDHGFNSCIRGVAVGNLLDGSVVELLVVPIHPESGVPLYFL